MFYTASHAGARFPSQPEVEDESRVFHRLASEAGGGHARVAQKSFDDGKQGGVWWHGKDGSPIGMTVGTIRRPSPDVLVDFLLV